MDTWVLCVIGLVTEHRSSKENGYILVLCVIGLVTEHSSTVEELGEVFFVTTPEAKLVVTFFPVRHHHKGSLVAHWSIALDVIQWRGFHPLISK